MKMQSGWRCASSFVAPLSLSVGGTLWLVLNCCARHLRVTRIIYILYTRSSFFFLFLSLLVVVVVVVVVYSPLKNITAHACPIASVALASSSCSASS
jgi:hypothetical protein